jgi:hypothetical protein
MLTTHVKDIFLVFSKFCKFLFVFSYPNFYGFSRFCKFLFGFMQDLESGKDTWYKLPLGVPPQASFRLTTTGWDWSPSNGSRPSTPPDTAAATAPCRGVFRQCDTVMLGMSRSVGAAYVSWMLSLCTHSSPNCWVMAPNPRDEVVRLVRLGAPVELELVDRQLGACRAHSSMIALCQDEPPASCWFEYCGYWGGGVGAASLLALLLVILPGKPEELCLWPPSRGTRGMVSKWQLYKWNSTLDIKISFIYPKKKKIKESSGSFLSVRPCIK